MSILSKRRKKSQLIRGIRSSASPAESDGDRQVPYRKQQVQNRDKNPRGLNSYEEELKRFRLTFTCAVILLFTLWWIPLLGVIVAGYLIGRIARGRWLALKAVAVPVLIIAVIVNLVQFGVLPRLDLAWETGQFFMAFMPGVYNSLAPSIIPVVSSFSSLNIALAIGPNGYLVICLIMTYLGGLVSERKLAAAHEVTSRVGKRSQGTREKTDEDKQDRNGDGDGRFLYRWQNHHSEFDEVADRLKKISRSASQPSRNASAEYSFGSKIEKAGWVRKEHSAASGEAIASGTGDGKSEINTTNQHDSRHSPRFVSRPTAGNQTSGEGSAPQHGRRTTMGNAVSGGGRTGTILPAEDEAPDGVDTLRRIHVRQRGPMSRGIVDRAVKSYHSETRPRQTTADTGADCQMGHSYKQRNYDSL